MSKGEVKLVRSLGESGSVIIGESADEVIVDDDDLVAKNRVDDDEDDDVFEVLTAFSSVRIDD